MSAVAAITIATAGAVFGRLGERGAVDVLGLPPDGWHDPAIQPALTRVIE